MSDNNPSYFGIILMLLTIQITTLLVSDTLDNNKSNPIENNKSNPIETISQPHKNPSEIDVLNTKNTNSTILILLYSIILLCSIILLYSIGTFRHD